MSQLSAQEKQRIHTQLLVVIISLVSYVGICSLALGLHGPKRVFKNKKMVHIPTTIQQRILTVFKSQTFDTAKLKQQTQLHTREKYTKKARMTTPAEVRHLSTTIIRPTTTTQTESIQRIELTPWDLSLLPIHLNQKGLLFMKPKHEDCQSLINHLKTSFSQALNIFYPLAGRLGTTFHEEDNTTTVFINCNSAGAEFIHAVADITIAYILNPTYVPRIVNSFFPLNGVTNYDGRTQPLLSVQVTELFDGIFIGCSLNHAVCDGTSFWHFINSWSEIARASSEKPNQISRPPIFTHWFPHETAFPIRLPFGNDDHFRKTHIIPPLEERFFHFSPENIAKLKSKANSEKGSDSNQKPISSFQALIAHVWLAATRAKRFALNEEVTYRLLMGNRSRLNPPLPQEYCGNSANSGFAKIKVAELLERGLGFAASLLNQVVNSHNDESIRSSWKSWVENPILLFFSNLDSNTFVTGSSPRFNMYGNDFGWGRPIAVRSGCANKFFDGKITIYPGAVEGSIDIEASMVLETLKAMGDDAEFMEAVTILPPFKSNIEDSPHSP